MPKISLLGCSSRGMADLESARSALPSRTTTSFLSSQAYTSNGNHSCLVTEILENIFLHLDVKSLTRCSQVCRTFRSIRWLIVDFRHCPELISDDVLRYVIGKKPQFLIIPRARRAPMLAPIVISCPTLKMLDCSSCELSEIDVEHISLGLLSLYQTVRHINLRGNKFGDAAVSILASAIEGNTTIETLNLANCNLTALCATSLCKMLSSSNSGLKRLNLADNNLRGVAIVQIFKACEGSSRLECLDVSSNNFSNPQSCNAIASFLKTNSSLKMLLLNDNNISNGVGVILKALLKNRTLEHLDLESNKINHRDINGLSAIIEGCSLIELNLRDNSLCDRGIEALSEGLALNTSLKKLCLDFNGIGGVGMHLLGRAIKKNSSLTHLSLRFNRFSESGAKGFANGVASNKSLIEIRLDDCSITTSVMRKLMAMNHNPTLSRLSLRNNQLGDAAVSSICELIRKLSGLEMIDLSVPRHMPQVFKFMKTSIIRIYESSELPENFQLWVEGHGLSMQEIQECHKISQNIHLQRTRTGSFVNSKSSS